MSSRSQYSVFQLSSRIHVVPIRHGSGDIAQEVRELLLRQRFDCVAVPLPPSLQSLVEQGIEDLPQISAVMLGEPPVDGEPMHSMVPIDPCQPVIMALRVAMVEGIPREFIDRDVQRYEPSNALTPDPYALKSVSLAAYAAAILPYCPVPEPDSQRWQRIAWMAFRLHELELDFQAVVCLCPIEDWPWLRLAYQRRSPYQKPEPPVALPALYRITPNSLYFLLGELPFITELYERRRMDARADTHLTIDGLKELLVETRRTWLANHPQEGDGPPPWISPHVLQRYLQYVRNLALLERRFTPDLYTLVRAAQQFGGDEFALTLLAIAKAYSWEPADVPIVGPPPLTLGIDEAALPDGSISKVKNRLAGQPLVWRSLALRPTPAKRQKRDWTYQWNPFRQCSWPPEDTKIEAFTAHVRHHAKALLGAELARVEKFSTSLRDGIDIRETLRNWKSPRQGTVLDIYVKDIPPCRGGVEVLVFLFEVPADPQRFSWQATWYAEHQEESTLCFYATPFLENLIGPGIGEAHYGGAMFLFPPRPIPDIWEDPRFTFTQTLEERLIAGACAHSQEAHVALVSIAPPKAAWRRIAKRFNRTLIPIALSRFSRSTVDRLRRFHVLNGHEIRSYAARFIRQ